MKTLFDYKYTSREKYLNFRRLDTDSFVIRGDKELKLETNKSKGTQKCIVKNHIRMKNYIDTLETGKPMKHKQINFRTDSHQIYTSASTKISLSAFDSKRFLTDSPGF